MWDVLPVTAARCSVRILGTVCNVPPIPPIPPIPSILPMDPPSTLLRSFPRPDSVPAPAPFPRPPVSPPASKSIRFKVLLPPPPMSMLVTMPPSFPSSSIIPRRRCRIRSRCSWFHLDRGTEGPRERRGGREGRVEGERDRGREGQRERQGGGREGREQGEEKLSVLEK